MNETTITFTGWVGSEINFSEGNTPMCHFRVGTTPRVRRNGEWVDADTVWQTVKVWRSLAEHCRDSLKLGDPVLVHGRLVADVWVKDDGTKSVKYVVHALSLGHDLTKGSTSFSKAIRVALNEPTDDEETRRLIHESEDPGLQLDSNGQISAPIDDVLAGESASAAA